MYFSFVTNFCPFKVNVLAKILDLIETNKSFCENMLNDSLFFALQSLLAPIIASDTTMRGVKIPTFSYSPTLP